MVWSCNKKGCDHNVAFWFQGGTFSQRCRSIMHRSQLECFDGNDPKLSRAFCAGVSRHSNEDITNSGLVFAFSVFCELCHCVASGGSQCWHAEGFNIFSGFRGKCIMCRCLWPSKV